MQAYGVGGAMSLTIKRILLSTILVFAAIQSGAQPVEINATPLDDNSSQQPPPEVGRRAADKYMDAKPTANGERPGPRDHYMTLHFGTFISSKSYEWGDKGGQKDPGRANFGVTYRIGEWVNTFDLMLRADFMMFELPQGDPFKMAVVPLFIFPDSASRFPIYFGAGAGPGVFFNQVSGSSRVSFDYQLVAGLRFFGLYKTSGFNIETGLKNHLHLTSDGQFNGLYLTMGGVFAF